MVYYVILNGWDLILFLILWAVSGDFISVFRFMFHFVRAVHFSFEWEKFSLLFAFLWMALNTLCMCQQPTDTHTYLLIPNDWANLACLCVWSILIKGTNHQPSTINHPPNIQPMSLDSSEWMIDQCGIAVMLFHYNNYYYNTIQWRWPEHALNGNGEMWMENQGNRIQSHTSMHNWDDDGYYFWRFSFSFIFILLLLLLL